MSATCGCCAGTHAETPRLVANRPGLSAISYRAGDHGAFKRSMLTDLRRTKVSTRDDDDFSVALIDAWAVTADVLTFYQERIAHESYLRTAGERLSVLELARLIGYELAPGVAATVWLAFTVDDAEGAPKAVVVDPGSRVQSVPGQNEQPQTFETSNRLDARAEWNVLAARVTKVQKPLANGTRTFFKGTATNIRTGDGLLFYDAAGTAQRLRRVAEVVPDFDNDRTSVTWTEPLDVAFDSVRPLRVQAPLFGYNAPDPRVMKDVPPALLDQTLPNDPGEWNFDIVAGMLFLDGAHPEIRKESAVAVAAPGHTTEIRKALDVAEVARRDYAISGKATRVTVDGANPSQFAKGSYRSTRVFAAPEALDLAEHPDVSPTSTTEIELDRVVEKLEKDRAVIVRGINTAGKAVSELAFVADVVTTGNHSTLKFTRPLEHSYERPSVLISGNVVDATHGESVREVLGSGDASVPYQRFRLSHVPLTYVPAPHEPDGAGTTLSIFVNEIRWREVPTLYGAGRYDRVYITRRDDEGRTTVQFGDGVSGSRLPTGNSNVRAVYRKGIGLDGNVDAGKVMLLLSRPLGLSEVTNPLPAAGGDVPEVLAGARRNAPRTALTLDRAVSILDYQAFAASFAGIAKAIATETLSRTEKQVFLTVAAPGGVPFVTDEPLRALRTALTLHAKPYFALRILPYEPVKFRLVAFVGVAADHLPEVVLPRVRAAVESAFSFDARQFGEAVDLSDVVKVIHSVDGVVSVDVDELARELGPLLPKLNSRLGARLPEQRPDGTLVPAEILTLGTYVIDEVPR